MSQEAESREDWWGPLVPFEGTHPSDLKTRKPLSQRFTTVLSSATLRTNLLTHGHLGNTTCIQTIAAPIK